jgi:hypothetical protein
MAIRAAALLAACVAVSACGSIVPHPAYSTQRGDGLVKVDRPPPPARVELVPPSPAPGAVWIDGEWIWRRARWAWLPGRWVIAPAGATFAPWMIVRGADGQLWYAPGVWCAATCEAGRVEPPTPLAIASVQGGDVVNADGTTETTGPIVRERSR